MQTRIVERSRLLDERGRLRQRGYATALLAEYRREDIKASRFRIKEWDYYLVHNREYGIALTVADNSYLGAVSISFLDFVHADFKTTTTVLPFTFGKLGMPESSESGDLVVRRKNFEFAFLQEAGGRRLKVQYKRFRDEEDFVCDVLLSGEPGDSMVIATPFAEDAKAFYYNQKINCMRAEGFFSIGTQTFLFCPEDAVALLDWGRGVWTYSNTWYWGSASGYINGECFGFNIGYGFGDTSAATENMLFYKGVAHKLDQVTFNIPVKEGKFDYLFPWSFTSNDGRLKMDFVPVLDRKDYTSVGFIVTDQHQVFGHFSGKVVLDNGDILEIRNLLGFAERVANKW